MSQLKQHPLLTPQNCQILRTPESFGELEWREIGGLQHVLLLLLFFLEFHAVVIVVFIEAAASASI